MFLWGMSNGENNRKDLILNNPVQLLDVVALTVDLPQHKLHCGQVGTVVEILAPDVFEVEFSDDEGQAYATLALRSDQLMVLHYRLVEST
jgi:hypothetical protein